LSVDPIIFETVDAILGDLCSGEAVRAAEADGRVPASLWEAVCAGGFNLVGLPEDVGGGGTLQDAASLLRLVGRHAAPIPLAEAGILGGWLLCACGLPVPDAMITVAPPHDADTLALDRDGTTLNGQVHRVPWANQAERLVAVLDTGEGPVVVSAPLREAIVTAADNLAGEPRCSVRFEHVLPDPTGVAPAPDGIDRDALRARGALTRALMITGALERVLDLTVEHANTRRQFGHPLSRFQAVAQNLALLAEEVMQARMAAELGTLALARGDGSADAGVAKIIAGAAATTGARIAHQVHGAIGITSEYELQLLTRRLWSWRDEYGSEYFWSVRVGSAVLARGPEFAWDTCAAAPGAVIGPTPLQPA
jgi:acyl-CoA dehydrogenase